MILEESLKSIIKLAKPLFDTGELTCHHTIIIDYSGVKIVQDECFIPSDIEGEE